MNNKLLMLGALGFDCNLGFEKCFLPLRCGRERGGREQGGVCKRERGDKERERGGRRERVWGGRQVWEHRERGGGRVWGRGGERVWDGKVRNGVLLRI